MQLGNNFVIRLLLHDFVFLRAFLANIAESEPALEDLQVVKNLRVHEVQERPELIQCILDRRTRK